MLSLEVSQTNKLRQGGITSKEPQSGCWKSTKTSPLYDPAYKGHLLRNQFNYLMISN